MTKVTRNTLTNQKKYQVCSFLDKTYGGKPGATFDKSYGDIAEVVSKNVGFKVTAKNVLLCANIVGIGAFKTPEEVKVNITTKKHIESLENDVQSLKQQVQALFIRVADLEGAVLGE